MREVHGQMAPALRMPIAHRAFRWTSGSRQALGPHTRLGIRCAAGLSNARSAGCQAMADDIAGHVPFATGYGRVRSPGRRAKRIEAQRLKPHSAPIWRPAAVPVIGHRPAARDRPSRSRGSPPALRPVWRGVAEHSCQLLLILCNPDQVNDPADRLDVVVDVQDGKVEEPVWS